jgi:hypothetical protein
LSHTPITGTVWAHQEDQGICNQQVDGSIPPAGSSEIKGLRSRL